MGICQCVIYPTVHCLLSFWAAPSERASFVGICWAGSAFGTLIAMSICGYLCDLDFLGKLFPLRKNSLGGWPLCFYIFGILGLVWALLWAMYVLLEALECVVTVRTALRSVMASLKRKWTTLPVIWYVQSSHCHSLVGRWGNRSIRTYQLHAHQPLHPPRNTQGRTLEDSLVILDLISCCSFHVFLDIPAGIELVTLSTSLSIGANSRWYALSDVYNEAPDDQSPHLHQEAIQSFQHHCWHSHYFPLLGSRVRRLRPSFLILSIMNFIAGSICDHCIKKGYRYDLILLPRWSPSPINVRLGCQLYGNFMMALFLILTVSLPSAFLDCLGLYWWCLLGYGGSLVGCHAPRFLQYWVRSCPLVTSL